jgi:hypothetical protein
LDFKPQGVGVGAPELSENLAVCALFPQIWHTLFLAYSPVD